MNKYRILVHGRNYIIDLGSGVAKYGFYTTRYVEAADEYEGELKAMETIRRRHDIKDSLHNEKDDPPLLYADEIVELKTLEGINRDVELGFSWYLETEEKYT